MHDEFLGLYSYNTGCKEQIRTAWSFMVYRCQVDI